MAGKMKARFNAVKHGLAAKLDILPGEDADAFQSRMAAWTDSLQPRDEFERSLIERAVQVSWQLDRADRAQAARIADARFAGSVKAGQRADEVVDLGHRLFWDPRSPDGFALRSGAGVDDPALLVPWSGKLDDPDDPARLLIRLEGSALGCAWLLDRWDELRDVLEEGRLWQAQDRFRAVRLLGKQPLDAVNDREVMSIYLACAAMERDGPPPFADITEGLPTRLRERYAERLEGRGAMTRIPADAETGRAELLALTIAEEERLEELLAVYLEREESAAERLGFDESEEGEWLRRYQLTFNRTLLRILETLRKRQQAADRPTSAGRGAGRRPDPIARGTDNRNHRPPDDLLASMVELLESQLQAQPDTGPESDGQTYPSSADASGSDSGGAPTDVPPSAGAANPPESPNSKNEPNVERQPARPCGDLAASACRNSKNEPNEAPEPDGRRASGALFGFLSLLVAALFTVSGGAKPRVPSIVSALRLPVRPLLRVIGRHFPPRLALIPISDRPRSSPS